MDVSKPYADIFNSYRALLLNVNFWSWLKAYVNYGYWQILCISHGSAGKPTRRGGQFYCCLVAHSFKDVPAKYVEIDCGLTKLLRKWKGHFLPHMVYNCLMSFKLYIAGWLCYVLLCPCWSFALYGVPLWWIFCHQAMYIKSRLYLELFLSLVVMFYVLIVIVFALELVILVMKHGRLTWFGRAECTGLRWCWSGQVVYDVGGCWNKAAGTGTSEVDR